MTESDLAPYTGALLKPSAGREGRGFTAEPAHYDGNHKALIFPHRLAVERLARSYVRDVLRWTSADGLTACDPIHEALPRAAVEQLAHGWSSWIHDCDRERGLEYCRARIAWLIGTELAHERHGLLALDMTHPHPLAEEIGRRYELGLPFESLFEALPH